MLNGPGNTDKKRGSLPRPAAGLAVQDAVPHCGEEGVLVGEEGIGGDGGVVVEVVAAGGEG